MKLQTLIEQYITFRKSLGELQNTNAISLRAFGRSIGADVNVTDVSEAQVASFLAGTGPRTLNWHVKLSVLRPFYEYAVSREFVATPPLPTTIPKRPAAFVPYIYNREDLMRLLNAIAANPRNSCLASMTTRAMILVMYGSGLRIQEAIDLNQSDVNCDELLLTVRQSKFGKTRLVPIGPQLCKVLSQYACQVKPTALADAPFFIAKSGARVKADTFQHQFRFLCEYAGIRRTDGARYQPRIHDLRHTFAVHRLTSWYRQGADVQRLLPHLSVYLGHVHLRATQVYLTMTPELLQEACKRFETYATGNEVDHA
jgi:site-specific recombinase XerD